MKLLIRLCLSLALLPFSLYSAACVLRVQVSEFPPYSYQEHGQWQGSRVVLSERLAQKLNCDVQYVDVPWARALLLLRSGDLDLMFNLTPTPQRREYIWFSRPHHMEKLAFATTLRQTEWLEVKRVNNLRQFPGVIALTEGAFMGSAMEKLLTEATFQRKIIAVAERRVKNELLLRGRAQGLVEDYDYLRFAIANFPAYQDVVITPLILSATPVYLGISRNSPIMQLENEVKKALNELDAAGLWFSEGT